jgi:hypothetical protein
MEWQWHWHTVKTLLKGAVTVHFMHIALERNGDVPGLAIFAWFVVMMMDSIPAKPFSRGS